MIIPHMKRRPGVGFFEDLIDFGGGGFDFGVPAFDDFGVDSFSDFGFDASQFTPDFPADVPLDFSYDVPVDFADEYSIDYDYGFEPDVVDAPDYGGTDESFDWGGTDEVNTAPGDFDELPGSETDWGGTDEVGYDNSAPGSVDELPGSVTDSYRLPSSVPGAGSGGGSGSGGTQPRTTTTQQANAPFDYAKYLQLAAQYGTKAAELYQKQQYAELQYEMYRQQLAAAQRGATLPQIPGLTAAKPSTLKDLVDAVTKKVQSNPWILPAVAIGGGLLLLKGEKNEKQNVQRRKRSRSR